MTSPAHGRTSMTCDPADYLDPDKSWPDSQLDLAELAEEIEARFQRYRRPGVSEAGWNDPKTRWRHVLDFVREYGTLALLSRTIIAEIRYWEFRCEPGADQGVSALERFGAELLKGAKRRGGSAKGPVTSGDARAKSQAVTELTRLKRRLFEHWPTTEEAAMSFITDQVMNTNAYPFLGSERNSFFGFLAQNHEVLLDFRGRDPDRSSRGLRPERLYHRWIAWSHGGLAEEHVRHLISKGLKPKNR